MTTQTRSQKETVARVMHEFKHGDLEQSNGQTVENPKQAIAIALREAGASRDEDGKTNARALRRTKRKERDARPATAGDQDRSRSDLYAEARKRDIPGRSGMTKSELAAALQR